MCLRITCKCWKNCQIHEYCFKLKKKLHWIQNIVLITERRNVWDVYKLGWSRWASDVTWNKYSQKVTACFCQVHIAVQRFVCAQQGKSQILISHHIIWLFLALRLHLSHCSCGCSTHTWIALSYLFICQRWSVLIFHTFHSFVWPQVLIKHHCWNDDNHPYHSCQYSRTSSLIPRVIHLPFHHIYPFQHFLLNVLRLPQLNHLMSGFTSFIH